MKRAPVKENDVHDKEDILPFALEGLRVNDRLYGIPVFLCGNLLIYDENEKELSEASHITDLSDESKILAINSDNPLNRPQYTLEAIADLKGEANPVMDDSTDEIMKLIDRLTVDDCKKYDNPQLAKAYDSGLTKGYIGFSESMRLLQNRADTTKIKAISFSDKENIPRLYTDAAAITAGVKGKRYEKCVEMINVMADVQVLADLSVQNGSVQYLLLAKKSPYQKLAAQFPMYSVLEGLASDPGNQVILTP